MAIETIKLTDNSKKEISPVPEAGARFIGKVFEKKDDKWTRLETSQLMQFSLSDLASGNIRFMCELWIDGERSYIVSHEEDEEPLHIKYPHACVVNLARLYRFLLKCAKNEKWLEMLPKMMICLNTFNAKVVK